MKRRDFIASTGVTAGILSCGATGNAAPAQLAEDTLQQIETAIKGGFGPGFTLRSAKRSNGRITAFIEHNNNHLEVASTDLVEWSVLRATDM